MKRAILISYLSVLLCLITAQTAHAGWTEPVPVQELNMSGDELTPYLSADGQIMMFSAQGTVTMSHWNGNSWGPREYLPSPINYVGLQRQAAITPDKCWIYWVSWRAGGMGMWDIWRASWNDSSHTCGPAECLGPNVNSADIEFGICFTANGQRMYFDTDTRLKNGQYNYGTDDIWYTDWDSTLGNWGEPFNLGPIINTTDLEEFPFISNDENILYFSCPGAHRVPGWQGEDDIYKAIKNENGWSYVENLLRPINSPTLDFGPTITPDNIKLYFCTHRDRNPNLDYELMVSTWEPDGIFDDIEPRVDSIKIEYYPNPFNEQIEIQAYSPTESMAEISIYDINGQKVRKYDLTIINGCGTTTWDSRNQQGQKVATGNYLVKVNFLNGKEIRKIVTLLK
jgi:hypothetical protein